MRTLNEYFAAVSEVVDRHDGVLTAYQGDAMLIGFNTARPDPDHAAARAAHRDRHSGDGRRGAVRRRTASS